SLLEPLAVDLTPRQAARLADRMAVFTEVGFQIEPFGGATYLLRAVPSIMAGSDPRQSFLTILDELAEEDEGRRVEHGGVIVADLTADGTESTADPLRQRREAMLIASVCKQAAIKAGRVLSLPEMQELIGQLEQSQSPRTCPHGRPTMVKLGLDQLAREFGRR
ncbi:MAG: hypothetical protein HYR71_13045, partial [Chloroflexi bacterium]|nr:hypothetical protein [Chloroflexota bacterium]